MCRSVILFTKLFFLCVCFFSSCLKLRTTWCLRLGEKSPFYIYNIVTIHEQMQWMQTKIIRISNLCWVKISHKSINKQQKSHLVFPVISSSSTSHFNNIFHSFPKNVFLFPTFLSLSKSFPHFPNTPLSLNICQHFFCRVHPNLAKTHTFSLHLLESSKGPSCFSSYDSTPLLHHSLQVWCQT